LPFRKTKTSRWWFAAVRYAIKRTRCTAPLPSVRCGYQRRFDVCRCRRY
jgi:hypothetical protein